MTETFTDTREEINRIECLHCCWIEWEHGSPICLVWKCWQGVARVMRLLQFLLQANHICYWPQRFGRQHFDVLLYGAYITDQTGFHWYED